jgi:hypothetical protein
MTDETYDRYSHLKINRKGVNKITKVIRNMKTKELSISLLLYRKGVNKITKVIRNMRPKELSINPSITTITINVPVVYMALYVMGLRRARSITRVIGRG